jgi:LacI family transcriptional regulator
MPTTAHKEAAIEAVLRRRVDGIILIAQRVDLAQVARSLDAGIRVVGVGPYLRAAGVDTVAIDERQAVGELMSLLIERGHRRIAHLAGPPDSAPGEARLLGYRAALDATGIPSIRRWWHTARSAVEASRN